MQKMNRELKEYGEAWDAHYKALQDEIRIKTKVKQTYYALARAREALKAKERELIEDTERELIETK